MSSQLPNDPRVRELLASSPSSSPVMYDPLAPKLPLSDMPWEDFERLCCHLIAARNDDSLQSFRYGSAQQGQGGVDVFSIQLATGRLQVVQCKRIQRVARGNISKWVDEILERADLGSIDEFILAVTADIEHDRHLIDEWHSAVKRLSEVRVRGRLWDFQQLEEALRVQPGVVTRFFGSEAARRFCAKAVPLNSWPKEYRTRTLLSHGNNVVLENRSLRLDLSVPSEDYPRVTAALSFTRADLSGISLTIDGRTLVSWLQWIAHSPSLERAPFLVALPRESRFLLRAPTAHLQMVASEVEDLEWVLREAWARYEAAAVSLDRKWRGMRFPLFDRDSEMTFSLCKVERWFWRALLAYAHEYDYDKGTSDNHIFDGGAACLKVYVREPRAGLEPGYHLIAYGRSDNHSALADGGVIIAWQRFSDIGGRVACYSPSAAWDAEFTHRWLMQSLFPAVLRWVVDTEKKNRGLLDRLFFNRRAGTAPELELGNVAYSCALTSYPAAALRLNDLSEAVHVARTLQSHFTVYTSEVPVEAEMRRQVLQLIARLLPTTEQPYDIYIRGKLGIETPSLIEGVLALLKPDERPFTASAELDMALRSLIAVLERRESLSAADLDYVSVQLDPLWSRWREDTICRVYS